MSQACPVSLVGYKLVLGSTNVVVVVVGCRRFATFFAFTLQSELVLQRAFFLGKKIEDKYLRGRTFWSTAIPWVFFAEFVYLLLLLLLFDFNDTPY